jgi:glycosyltransferase involved in cell wall biosynthesis
MRVATVITRLNIGGASPPVISIAVGLRDRGHESLLIVGEPEPGEGSLESEAAASGIRIAKIPDLRRDIGVSRDLRVLRELVRQFRAFRPDVVATHMSKAGALGRIAARLAGVPVVVHTYHGKGFDVFPRGWRRTSTIWLERALSRLAAGNVVLSATQEREFLGLGLAPASRMCVIRLGLDLDPFICAAEGRGRLRDELDLPEDALLVGVVARVVAIKGQDVFVRAVARLGDAWPSARFLVVGDGSFRAECEALGRTLGVGDRIRYLGWRRDIPGILSSLDVVVLPTVMDFEGTPVALIEALAARRAVVASNVGGVAEVIHEGRTGRLVPPRDPDALAAAISGLLGDPATRDAYGLNGQALVCERHAMGRMIDETERYYLDLLQPRNEAHAVAL